MLIIPRFPPPSWDAQNNGVRTNSHLCQRRQPCCLNICLYSLQHIMGENPPIISGTAPPQPVDEKKFCSQLFAISAVIDEAAKAAGVVEPKQEDNIHLLKTSNDT